MLDMLTISVQSSLANALQPIGTAQVSMSWRGAGMYSNSVESFDCSGWAE